MTKKVFCLHYAGGSAAVFRNWMKESDETLEIIPIELAGRGKRINEPLFDCVEMAVNDLIQVIKKSIQPNEPYVLFGHSLGGLLVYEIARAMQNDSVHLPDCIFVSAVCAPNAERKSQLSTLNDQALIQELFKLGGTPKVLLESSELMEFYLPIIRSDFKLYDTYKWKQSLGQIMCPIHVIYGKNDTVTEALVKEWIEFTTGKTTQYELNEGHFYLETRQDELLSYIRKILFKD